MYINIYAYVCVYVYIHYKDKTDNQYPIQLVDAWMLLPCICYYRNDCLITKCNIFIWYKINQKTFLNESQHLHWVGCTITKAPLISKLSSQLPWLSARHYLKLRYCPQLTACFVISMGYLTTFSVICLPSCLRVFPLFEILTICTVFVLHILAQIIAQWDNLFT